MELQLVRILKINKSFLELQGFFIYLFYLLINIKIDKSVIPHQCISVINEADIVLNKKEIIKK